LNDRAPFLVVGMDLGVEGLRRAADRLRAELAEPLLDLFGIQRRDEIMRELCDKIRRHIGWPKKSPPHLGVVARHGLTHARYLGKERRARGGGHRERADST